jgi:hypothetical protein
VRDPKFKAKKVKNEGQKKSINIRENEGHALFLHLFDERNHGFKQRMILGRMSGK